MKTSPHRSRPLARGLSGAISAALFIFLGANAAQAQVLVPVIGSGLNTGGDKDGGITWTDFNRDGCLDLFVNTDSASRDSRLYVSDCGVNPTFTDVTTTLIDGFTDSTEERSAVSGDLTGDGYQDLLRNDSDAVEIYFSNGLSNFFTFGDANQDPDFRRTNWNTPFGDGRAFNTEGAAYLDYDGDGDLDVVLENHSRGVVLLQNDGAGNLTFVIAGLPTTNSGDGDYLAVADIDLDGDTDILARKGGPDIFTNRRSETGVATFEANPNFNQPESNGNKGGISVCDFNNDGRPDLFWTDNGTNQIWRNDGNDANNHTQFSATGEPAASSGTNPTGIDHAECGDIDNDGDLDLFLSASGADFLYRNNGNFSFTRVLISGLGATNGEGAKFGDYDRDGDLDLIINQDSFNELWENTTNNGNYVLIEPTLRPAGGVDTPAYGATVVLRDNTNTIVGVREVMSGYGHGVSGTGSVHFGFANPNVRHTATITYPNGATSQVCFTPSQINGYKKLYVRDTDPATCVPLACGDGMQAPEEECDDSNTAAGDGCSSSCTIETGYVCQLEGEFAVRFANSPDDRLIGSDNTSWYRSYDGETIMETLDGQGFYPITPTHQNQTYKIRFTARDNDTVGFAFGYRPGEVTDADADYYLFQWCDSDCSSFGVGATLIHVTESMSKDDFFNGAPGITLAQRGLVNGTTALNQDQEYEFTIQVSGNDRIQVAVDGVPEIDFTAPQEFTEGFAAFIFDMSNSPFTNDTPVGTESICTLPNCGDGDIDAGEACDDGNDLTGDGCSFCRIEAGFDCANGTSGTQCVIVDVPADGATLASEGSYSGRATPGATVQLRWRDDGNQTDATLNVTADAAGNWTAPVQNLDDDTYELRARVNAGGANAQDTNTFTLDTSTTVTLVAPADGSTTSDATPTFSGTGEPGATVRVIVDGAQIGSTVIPPSGDWSFTPTTPIADGSHTVSVEAEDAQGNIAMDGPHTFTIDSSTTVTLVNPANGSTTSDTTPTISGTGEAGATVRITVDGTQIGTTVIPPSGSWSFTPTTPLADGSHTVSVVAQDAQGNMATDGPHTFSVDSATAVTLVNPANGSTTSDTTPTFSGTGEAGATVSITVDGTQVGTTVIPPSGNWSFTPTTPLADGSHTVSVAAQDAQGNMAADGPHTFTIDSATTVTLVTPANGSTTTDTTPTISGTGEPGATVRVTVDGTQVGTATVAGNGSWSFTPIVPLADGSHTVSVAAQDAQGNTASDGPHTFTIDSATSVTLTTPANGSTTSDTTPTFSGTGEPGATVRVTVDGTQVGTTVIPPSGNWSFTPTTPLADGSHIVSVVAQDAQGNMASDGPHTFTIDSGTAVTLVNPADGSTTSDTTPTISGTGEAGATVRITVDGTQIGTTVIPPSGSWSFTPTTPLADGSHTVSVVAQDAQGNMATDGPHTFSVDSATTVTLATPADSSVIEDTTPTFSGAGEPGATVRITVNGTQIGTATVAGNGSWSFTPTTPLTLGTHTVSVVAQDGAGNTAADGPHTFEIDDDFDDDTLTNDQERALGTDINNPDSDGDGVRDDVEVGADVSMPQNTDGDTLINALDDDDDGDGVLTTDEDLDGNGDPTDDNTDGDLLPDYLDTDDDDDLVLTENEPGDADGSGTPDRLEPCTPDADALACPTGDPDDDGEPNDTDPEPTNPCVPDPNALACDMGDADGDTLTNGQELAIGTNPNNPDTDGDGVRDNIEVGDVNMPTNTDMDMLINALDADDDGDGILSINEDLDGDGSPADDDTDGDMIPDYLDTDDDGDGTLSINEPGDVDNSNVPDRLEPCTPDADALACPTGDPDDDGEPNDTDPEPTNPCVPDPNALACDTGDADGDTLTNGTERMIGTNPNNPDSDGDGLRDDFEVGDINDPVNSDDDMLIDALDPDDDNDGVLTRDEDLDGDGDPTNDNSDGDTLPNYLDTDDDGDSKPTISEDLNNNGNYSDDDSDGDGIIEYLDPNDEDGPNGDLDGDGILNKDEDLDGDGDYDNDDTDGDMVPDYLDTDDDGDGVLTMDEDIDGDGNPADDDSDGDMIPNYLDTDDDGDGVLTEDEDVDMDGDPRNDDTNMNTVPDYLDPCDPDAMATACSDGDTDNDETPNDMDPDPLDPCVPNPNAVACDSGDFDMDGLSNGTERDIGTDPRNPDTDGDGVRDDVEVGDVNAPNNTDMDTLIDALDPDDDGDGISTRDEDLNGDGDPGNDNRDGDGLPNYLDPDDDDDGVLTRDEDIDGDGDPRNDNTDGDTLPDYLDTDDDNDEVLTINEPGDSDMSNTPDRLEPCTPDPNSLACSGGDTDGDETPNDMDPDPLDPCVPNPNAVACDSGDFDMDGLSNGTERDIGTDPRNKDSDSDGIEDGVEVGPDVNNPINSDDDNFIDAIDPDDDNDGIDTFDEDIDGDGDPTNDDTDGDMIPNYLDPDDDGDGVLTATEDLDNDGDPNNDDTDGDLVPNYLDEDDDNDTVLTRDEDVDGDGNPANDNSDVALGDMVPNYLDTDDDGDGVLTVDEDVDMDGDPRNDDTNMNGFANFLDPCEPDDTVLACLNGDTDGDGVINSIDPDPLDPCNPNPNALLCPTGDADMDGLDNQTERAIGTNPLLKDSDNDGIDDLVEVGDPANPTNTDGDALIDALDPDDDGDGIDTADEDLSSDGDPTNDDTDGDMIPNYLDADDDGDGVLTRDENYDGDFDPRDDDTDGDMVPDYLDTDDDGDGVLTMDEDVDMDGDPRNDDTDGDLLPNYLDTDDDGDTILTRDEDVDGSGDPADDDTDMDMLPNYLDADDDGDGVLTRFEDVNSDNDPTNDDTDMDMVPNYLDTDDDGDTIPTAMENADPNGDGDPADALDTDMDMVPDYLDPVDAPAERVDILSPTEGATTSPTPTFSGTATPGATVEVSVDGTSLGSVVADESGQWSLMTPEDAPLSEGAHQVSVETDSGAQDGPVSFTVDPDMEPDTVGITSPADGATVNMPEARISGTTNPGAQVEVFVNGTLAGTTTADDQGSWELDVVLSEGESQVEAVQGNARDSITVTYDPDAVVPDVEVAITSPAEGEATSSTPTFSGTATPNADVEVFVDGASVGVATADEGGAWTLTLEEAAALEPGAHTVRATATLESGESASSAVVNFVVDEQGVDDATEFILVGGCAQAPGAPAPFDAAPWLGVLGFLLLRRRRK